MPLPTFLKIELPLATEMSRIKIDGCQINQKRVYRIMSDERWHLFRQGQKILVTRKHEGTVAVKEAKLIVGAQIDWN